MSYYVLPACPTGCESAPAPYQFNDCAPVTNDGPIEYIYLRAKGNPMVDWTDPAEWAAEIDNTGISGTEIRQLHVMGELPAATENIKTIAGNLKIAGPKSFTINADVDETSDINYEAIRNNECNGNYSVWFETSDTSGTPGNLYGGNPGIQAFVSMNYVIAKDETAHDQILIVITWTSKFHPERIPSPIVHA